MAKKYVGLGKQVDIDTVMSPTEFIRVSRCTMRGLREMVAVETIRPEIEHMFPGYYNCSGAVELPIGPDIGNILMSAFGDVVTTSLGGTPIVYQHVFTPLDASELPYFTIAAGLYEANTARAFIGCIGRTLTIEARADGILIASCDYIGQSEMKGVQSVVTPYQTVRQFGKPDIVLKVGGSATQAWLRAIRIVLTNEVDTDDVSYGSVKRKSFPVGIRKVTGEIELKLDTSTVTMLERFYKAVGTMTLDSAVTPFTLELSAESEIISGANKYKITFLMNKVVLGEAHTPINKQDVTHIRMPFVAWKDPTLGTALKCTLINEVAAY